MWLYFLILGLGLGLILQVLVIAVQNSADYADLGAATSGATFFRSIGGSFGVAIFGSIFSNRLASEIVAELRGVRLPAGFNPAEVQAKPMLIRRLPAALRGDVLHAFSLSMQTVFLAAIPVALIAFVLSWFLREVPLRAAVGAAANPADVADGLGAAVRAPLLGGRAGAGAGPVVRHRPAAARLRADGRRCPASTCPRAAAGCSPTWPSGITSPGRSWPGRPASRSTTAGRSWTCWWSGHGHQGQRRAAAHRAGHAAADRLFAAKRDLLEQLIADWSPEQNDEVTELLTKLSRALLGEHADRGLLTSPAAGPSVAAG